ncbi:MAG: tyrosine-protein phosphatase [Chloroflexota bacterium]
MDGMPNTDLQRPQRIVFPIMAPPEWRESLRRIPLQGANNFRDLGGYATQDGRHTRWGLLYRSDRLSGLTNRDLLYLQYLDLHTIVDFRSAEERQEAPDRLPQMGQIRTLALPVAPYKDPETAVAISERIFKGDTDGLDAEELVLADYRRFVTHHTHSFRQFLHAVLEARGRPVLFHCTAGKDRTGFAAAILLRLLGVSDEAILGDYLLSNEYFLPGFLQQLSSDYPELGKTSVDFISRLAEINPVHLHGAYQAIDETYGSFEAFVRQGLAFGEQELDSLKQRLLA